MTQTDPETGTLQAALDLAGRMLGPRPDLAIVQAEEILKVAPGHATAISLLARAHLGFGLALARSGVSRKSVQSLRRAVDIQSDLSEAWSALAQQYRLLGETARADQAEARYLGTVIQDPVLLEAGMALSDGRLAVAEHLLRDLLKARPDEPVALRMLAEIATRLGRYEDAEALLRLSVDQVPGFHPARYQLAVVLYRQARASEALLELEYLLTEDPANPGYRNLKAAALGQTGDYDQTVAIYESLLADFPVQPKGWMSYGHALKTLGRQADAIAAYRHALDQMPGLGEAWWSLANLKTVQFSDADVAIMRSQLDDETLSEEDRFHLQFALGKAHEDANAPGQAFDYYAQGNALRRSRLDYDAEETSAHLERSRALFSPAFFAARTGFGCPAPAPIFILGLPRAGSTLIEQILASHSAVEGTMELPDMPALAKRLGGRLRRDARSAYPEVLGDLDADACLALGEEYLARTAGQRKLGRAHFIDKMPNNFSHLGLIHLILPNAKIIDARRHPLGCCFSGFKQHFARGQGFTYDLTDLGRYYADYVALMDHMDRVLPGRVHRVIYENLVGDLETEVRSLLDYCGLPFEDACLRFHENDRAVRTASSEQVRRPIFTEGVDQWRKFEPWLGPLKTALGPVLDSYPDVPDFTV